MTKKTATHICFDRVVPEAHDPVGVAKHKAAVDAFNAALDEHGVAHEDLPDLSADHPVEAFRMALVTQKTWPKGSTITCAFLDGEPAWQEKVKAKAKIWEQFANIKLNFVDGQDATIRISFFADAGSWSAVGKDALIESYFPKDQPTMNYGWLRDDTADEEYERVVVHEFGHALGCVHEHQSPTERLNWNRDAVYAAFSGPPNNWSKADIDHNILQKYGAAGIKATIFDRDSIMLYEFPPELFTDHTGTPLNQHLSAKDKSMIHWMYPA